MPVVLQTVPILHISKFQLFQLNYLLDLYICFTAPQTVPFFPAICTFTSPFFSLSSLANSHSFEAHNCWGGCPPSEPSGLSRFCSVEALAAPRGIPGILRRNRTSPQGPLTRRLTSSAVSRGDVTAWWQQRPPETDVLPFAARSPPGCLFHPLTLQPLLERLHHPT
mmetsp:Transcript_57777/g.117670  ORF Transcript_57777/g.117670 Transcript_57777/m.117670 type:complete len:166 (+) Transcript_57777:20-517(+)